MFVRFVLLSVLGMAGAAIAWAEDKPAAAPVSDEELLQLVREKIKVDPVVREAIRELVKSPTPGAPAKPAPGGSSEVAVSDGRITQLEQRIKWLESRRGADDAKPLWGSITIRNTYPFDVDMYVENQWVKLGPGEHSYPVRVPREGRWVSVHLVGEQHKEWLLDEANHFQKTVEVGPQRAEPPVYVYPNPGERRVLEQPTRRF